MAHNVSNEYKQVIYSGDARNQLKILFNGVELQNADRYCERMTVKSRIVPNGAKIFNLNNFISKEVEIIFHDIDTSIIQDQISISIGTLVGNSYEYVPIGIFNIQDTPTNDKNKTTIKLRDNSVKFDFNYNAKPLIDAGGGTATKLQILQDICSKAGVTCNITSFIGSTDRVGIYDNTITARQYIADLAEQAGKIATINRDGELIFVDLNSLTTWNIPLSIVEKYKSGKMYKIGKVVYEDGVIRYETPNTEFDTLYLDASNPYINSQEQVNNILNEVNQFEIDSIVTGKILGNPAIDAYDLINVYDDKSLNRETIFKTLATNELIYNGVLINTFDTQIGEEQREKNVTVIGEPTFKKWVKTEMNTLDGKITFTVGKVDDQTEQIAAIRLQYNELLSKIGDIADITTSAEDTDGNVTLENINASEPISIKIHPIGESISYLYPSDYSYPTTQHYPSKTGLTPSSTLTPNSSLVPSTGYPEQNIKYLKTRTLLFTNTATDETFPWILPTDLWYYDNTTYDELELSYGDGTNSNVIVTRRCKVNADGTVSTLTTPTTETYPYPTNLLLTDGDYTISLLGYSTAYLYVQLMAKNIYTSQFYTRAETNSLVSQTANSIGLSVDQKLSNYSTTSEMNSAITLKANEITSTVSDTYATKTTTNQLSSRISQTAKSIALTVNNGSTSSGITITTTKEDGTTSQTSGTIEMNGLVKFNDLSTSGSTTINGANITTGEIKSSNYQSGTSGTKISLTDGSIDTKGFKVSSTGNLTATSGNIAQYVIDGRKLKSTDGKAGMASSTTSGDPVFWAGYGDPWEHSDWASRTPFYVTNQGYLKASNASISGSIYSGSGTIGGWSINNGGLYATTNGYYVALYPDYLYASYPGDTVESRRWYNIVVGSPSDKKVKHDIKNINNLYEMFYDELNPVSFKYNDDFEPRKKESTHFGFIAQDIKKSIENHNLDDLAMIHGNKILKIDKDEIIALNTWQIQKLKKQVQEQQEIIDTLIQKIEKIERESDK